jgi:hypothetical protein
LLFVISKTLELNLIAKPNYLIQEPLLSGIKLFKQTPCYKAKLFHSRIIGISYLTLKTKLIATKPDYLIQEHCYQP